MDEATAALDSTSEALVSAAVAAITEQRTVITIAHRLSSIQGVDRVLVLDGGQVVEQGSPAELAQRPGGLFSRMVQQASSQQQGGRLDAGESVWESMEEAAAAAPGHVNGAGAALL